MKKIMLVAVSAMLSVSCETKIGDNTEDHLLKVPNISGTWKLVYAETKERDLVEVRDVATSDFIKIINKTFKNIFATV